MMVSSEDVVSIGREWYCSRQHQPR